MRFAPLGYREMCRERLDAIISKRIRPSLYVGEPDDVNLCCGNILERGQYSKYKSVMGPLIQDIYDEVYKGRFKQVPVCFWEGRQGRANAETCVEYAFTEILGLNMSRSPFSIDERLFRCKQKEFLGSVIAEGDKTWRALMVQLRLSGALDLPYFSSTYSLIRSTFPWAFNLATDEGDHLHPWDFRQNHMWSGYTGRSLARFALKHVMEKHYGLQMDRKNGLIDERLLPAPGRTRISSEPFGFKSWEEMFREMDLFGMVRDCQGIDGKTSKAFQLSYPWAFDLTKDIHLHSWAFTAEDRWKGEEGRKLAATTISHILEGHLGLKMTAPKEGVEASIDERLLKGEADRFLADNGFTDWAELFAAHLSIVYTMEQDIPAFKSRMGIRNVLEFVYPWAFDLDSPEGKHLHFWKIMLKVNSWEDPKDIVSAFKHEVQREGWGVSELPALVKEDWINSVGLGGLWSTKFGFRRLEMIRSVYPELSEISKQ